MYNYSEELSFVEEADDSIFPDFLFNPVFNDFGDEYYKKSFANDELITMVKKLRRRYSNFFDWVDAMDIYNEYMNELINKYGSMRVIKNALHVGTIDDPVPAKPKLKMTRRNRQFLRSGASPARQIEIEKPTRDEMIAIARQSFPDALGNDIDEADAMKKIPKDLQKRFRIMSENIAGSNRKKNMYRSVGNNSGTDFIIEYLNQTKRGIYDHSGNFKGNDDMSIADIIKENERIANTPPELLEEEDGNQTEIVNGQLVRKKDTIKLQVYKELFGEGIDVIGAFGKSMDKKAVKMIRSQIGDTEPATKKEMKKIKKRAKKEREQIERRRDNNRLLEQTLLGNKFDLTSNGNNLSFRLKDVYRD